jgi:hypothetical protein
MGRLVWLYLRLRRMDQIPLSVLRELSERSSLRCRVRVAEQQREAVDQLQQYLEAYTPPWENAGTLVSSIRVNSEIDRRLTSSRQHCRVRSAVDYLIGTAARSAADSR